MDKRQPDRVYRFRDSHAPRAERVDSAWEGDSRSPALDGATTAGRMIEASCPLTAFRHAIPDIDDLVTKLDVFYHNADRRSECRLAGRQFAQTLDWQTIREEGETLLADVGQS